MIKLLGKNAEDTKIVTCHIGNGSSISAVKGGKVMDTTMGFTPLEGLIIGTRCGNVDPYVVTYLQDKEGLTAAQVNDIMNKKSGFLGVTGLSSDSRDIEAAYNEGNEKAKLALDILKHQLKKYIGGYAAAMNGLDAVVFTAGIGENSSILRELVLSDMEYLGIELDREANKKAFRLSDAMMISTPDSKVKAYVIPTNEELVIAKDTAAIVENL